MPANPLLDRQIHKFFLLVFLAIGANYYLPGIITTLFYAIILGLYFRSKDEAFWLAFFLVASDGFFGFFGRYEALFHLLPGLPGIEVGQFYVLLSVYKASQIKTSSRPFFEPLAIFIFVYILFLIIQGYVLGISYQLNVQLRVVKLVIPFLLFYSIPRLFRLEDQYQQFFKYIFPVAIFAFGAQIFTILMENSPASYFGAKVETRHKILINLRVSEDKIYRGIYNEGVLILAYLGALYSLAIKSKHFKSVYLYIVIASVFFAYFLSATRGYILGFSMIFLLFVVFILGVSVKRIIAFALIGVALLFGLRSFPIFSQQMEHAIGRMMTLSALAEGDVTAGGTLVRLTKRGPIVMKKWRESPLTGWGFSNGFFEYADMHVANQNILMHSGIIGIFFMLLFFIFFNAKLLLKSINLARDNPYKKPILVFVVFFLGWFTIHSSTQYYFSYYLVPGLAIIQAVFFSYGALIYEKSGAWESDKSQTLSWLK